tara:strand:- start:3513 stop:4187 length:675 start_codon:yes stop_codon:yes gene_type:complete
MNIQTIENNTVITLKEICEILEVRHNDAMTKVLRLSQEPSFGTLREMSIVYNKKGQTIKTYSFTKMQAIAVGARLNNALLMKLVIKLEEAKPLTALEMARNYVASLEKIELQQIELDKKDMIISTNAPLVAFAEAVASSSDSILIRECSKVLGLKIGQNKLYELLREKGMILSKSTEPTQLGMDRGYFEVIESSIMTPKGSKLVSTTKLLPKGQLYVSSICEVK